MADNELIDGEMLGIGEAAREIAVTTSQRIKAIYDMAKAEQAARQELEERVKHIADAIDAANGKREKWYKAAIRAVKQFISQVE